MQTMPYVTAKAALGRTGLTLPTVNLALTKLQELGIVEEITKGRRNRVYAYRGYLDILGEGAQPLPR